VPVAIMALILPIYWAVPESPPRFALPGVIDSRKAAHSDDWAGEHVRLGFRTLAATERNEPDAEAPGAVRHRPE